MTLLEPLRLGVDEAARRSATLDQIVRQALERYVGAGIGESDVVQTWELGRALEVAEPDPEYIVGHDEQGNPIINYAAFTSGKRRAWA